MTTAPHAAEPAHEPEARGRAARERAAPIAGARPAPGVSALLRLQRSAGNAAVGALLNGEAPTVQRAADAGVASALRGQAERLIAAAPPPAEDDDRGRPEAGEVAAKKAELRGGLPTPGEAAAQAPRIQEAAGAARQEAKAPAAPLVAPGGARKPGGATAAAGAAAGLAERAHAMVAPEGIAEPAAVEPPQVVEPVDAGGAPLPPDPGGDAATSGIARRVQQLRQGGHALRELAARQVAMAHNIRGRIQLGMSRVTESESGVATLKGHTEHRREVVGQARSALEVSEQKADTVAQQAPDVASKGAEGKQKSGPMATEAGSLASENSGKRPDDADAAAKSQEQGQKLTKVSGDLTSMDSAIGQTQARAEGLAADAAQAKTKNAASRTKIGQTEATLARTEGKIAELTGQNQTAKSHLAGLQAGPGHMLAQAAALDNQGQAAIAASVALEQRLHGSEAAFRDGMASVPAKRPPANAPPVQRQEEPGARTTVNLGAGVPSWLSGADPESAQARQEAVTRERDRRRAEVAEIDEAAGGHFENLGAAQKAGIALRLTGRHLLGAAGATSIPGLVGGILRGFVDPRVSLMGVVQGLSMVVSGVANLFSAEQWARDPLGNLLQSAADIATGVAIILGSIAGLAVAIIVILTALTILTFGALGPVAAAVIPFCSTVAATVGPWALTAAEIALVLQGLLLIKNLIDAATASTATELQGKSDEMTADTEAAGQMALQIGMAKLGEGVFGEGEGAAAAEGEGAGAAEGAAPPAEAPPAPAEAAPAPAEAAPAPAEAPAPPAETGAPTAEGAPPAESAAPAEAAAAAEAPPAAEVPTAEGGKVKVTEDGRCEICASPCDPPEVKFGDELAERPDLAQKLQQAEAVEPAQAKAQAVAEVANELEAVSGAEEGLSPQQLEVLEEFGEAQQQASQGGLEGDVLEQPGMGERAKPGGRPQPEHFEVGNFGHTYAEELIPESEMPRGLSKEVTVEIPGGEVRLDRVDFENGVIYEVKPNTPESIAAGQDQVRLYVEYMNREYPLGGGRSWQGRVVTYDYPTAKRILLGK